MKMLREFRMFLLVAALASAAWLVASQNAVGENGVQNSGPGATVSQPQSGAPGVGGGGGNAAGQVQSARPQPVAVIEITEDFKFKPSPVTIRVGDTLRWVNVSRVEHTVTAVPRLAKYPVDVMLPANAEPFDSGYLQPGDGFRHTFTVPGKYKYVCSIHEAAQMIGEINVLPAQGR